MRRIIKYRRLAGFTLTEIMLVVAIIALTAAIAVPNHFRARKRAKASRLLDDLRTLDQAIDQYTIEHRRTGNETLTLTGLTEMKKYLKTDTALYSALPLDLVGNSFVVSTLAVPPKITSTTFEEFSDVAPLDFWSPYYP